MPCGDSSFPAATISTRQTSEHQLLFSMVFITFLGGTKPFFSSLRQALHGKHPKTSSSRHLGRATIKIYYRKRTSPASGPSTSEVSTGEAGGVGVFFPFFPPFLAAPLPLPFFFFAVTSGSGSGSGSGGATRKKSDHRWTSIVISSQLRLSCACQFQMSNGMLCHRLPTSATSISSSTSFS